MRSSRFLIGVATIIAGAGLLSACGDNESGKSDSLKKANSISQDNRVRKPSAKEDEEFEARNKPLHADFEAPELAEDSDYVDIQSKLNAIRLYHSLRNWSESDEEIANSISGAILVRDEAPKLYEYEERLGAAENAFEKRELTQNISQFVKSEAEKVRGRYRVRLVVDADFKAYDFEDNRFVSENCLFSEKLEYSKEEMRTPTAFAKAQKPRCYLQPSTTNFFVGIASGSKLNLKVTDEAMAKVVESKRAGLKYEIFGYIQSVERERLGGKLTEARRIMIEPQRVNLISRVDGKSIYAQVL